MAENLNQSGVKITKVQIGDRVYLVPERELPGVRKGVHDVRQSQGTPDDPEAVAKLPLEKIPE